MGFQHLRPIVHEAASRKGGRIKVDKGFAVNRDLAVEAGRKGGIAKRENQGKEPIKSQENNGESGSVMEQILRDLEVEDE